MQKEWDDVKEFQRCFGHPFEEKPKFIPPERATVRADWMIEEVNEFLAADEIVEQADAMIDLMYFALGTLVEMGVKPDNLWQIVQDANMAKLWPDGKPHYREDGKTIKPPAWEDPHNKLKLEIERQEQS